MPLIYFLSGVQGKKKNMTARDRQKIEFVKIWFDEMLHHLRSKKKWERIGTFTMAEQKYSLSV